MTKLRELVQKSDLLKGIKVILKSIVKTVQTNQKEN